MIDGGTPKKKRDFIKAMKNIALEPENIKLVVITDGHPDHIGSARDIKEVTKAKIAMHRLDKDCLESGKWKERIRQGGISNKLFGRVVIWFSGEIPSAEVELVVEDDGLSLKEYGVFWKNCLHSWAYDGFSQRAVGFWRGFRGRPCDEQATAQIRPRATYRR